MKLPREFIVYAVLLALVAVLPLAGAYPVFVMKVMCYALFACAFNLLIGFTGLLSFGHAAFLGGAAYAAGHALKVWGLPTEVGLAVGVLAGAALGLIMGIFAIRRSGIYFSMITLALAQMLYFFFLQAPFTGGEDGLQSVPRGNLLGVVSLESDVTLYYVVLGIFVAAFLLIYRTVHSPFGQVLKAIRENEARATSLGYDTARFKLLAFVLSAALARNYFVPSTVVQAGYPLDMRYAGPREALLHALFRQNYGCSHLIVGRDHAGVGSYYGPFDAHRIFQEIPPGALETQALCIDVAFWCYRCGGMASGCICPHGDADRLHVSGTQLRKWLSEGHDVPEEFSRPEVLQILREHYAQADRTGVAGR